MDLGPRVVGSVLACRVAMTQLVVKRICRVSVRRRTPYWHVPDFGNGLNNNFQTHFILGDSTRCGNTLYSALNSGSDNSRIH
jgi:hypothetical protein